VTPIAVAITAIDFDHEAFLGHTLEAIAAEKAGVIKEIAVVVLSANRPEVEQVVASACERRGARLIRAEEGARPDATLIDGRVHVRLTTPTRAYGQLHLSLRGRHQVANAVTAIRLLEALAAMRGFDIPVDAIRAGVETAVWPARLELIGERPRQLLIDGAHNPAGARALASYLLEAYTTRLPLVIAVMRDKHAAEIVAALAPAASHIVATAAQSSRALSPAALLAIVRDIAPRVSAESAASSVGAVERAWLAGSPVVVAGSLYLAGEVRAAFS
jgi:dihydrofolate synthase/folylpolyglutamate synthase